VRLVARELNKSTIVLCLLLAAVTVAVYWPVGHFAFVDYDDPVYVVENAHVRAGLTRAGIVWAFAKLTGDGTYWHPVTWLSHMLDCQIFGLKPGPPHLVNLAFHIANALILFLLLRQMTGAVWRSAAVAALFALHPWQVGTVAWVAERKNVLSTFFLMLTLWAYARYAEVQSPESKVPSPKSKAQSHALDGRWQVAESHDTQHAIRNTLHAPRFLFPALFYYVLALVLFALGLMSKSMLVTLPFALLLLDYWPLGRSAECGVQSAESGTGQGKFRAAGWGQLWLEKLPFFAMSAVVVWVTMAGHQRFSMAATSPPVPLAARLANGLVSYGRYIAGTFWPNDMAVLYPFPEHWPVALVTGAGVLLAGVSFWALWRLRQRPYFAVGWFWFLGTLVPVIGLVQDGVQAMADRYMYVPLIGLLVVLCWGTAEITGRLTKSSAGVTPAGSDGVPPPRRPGSRGGTPPLTRRRNACATWAAPIAAIVLMGCVWGTRHELQFWQNSVALFGRAVAVTQNNYIAEEDLGVALGKSGALAEARTHLAEALRIQPNNASAQFNLGFWLTLEGKSAEAAAHYREAIRLRPNYPRALNNLAWLLATHPDPRVRNGEEAVQLARRAADLTEGNDPGALDTLAAACAEAHQFAEAINVAERAATLAQSAGQKELARQIQTRLTGYRSEQAYREP
jgi:tetratricopeptide (TPR) repeat protein